MRATQHDPYSYTQIDERLASDVAFDLMREAWNEDIRFLNFAENEVRRLIFSAFCL